MYDIYTFFQVYFDFYLRFDFGFLNLTLYLDIEVYNNHSLS
jgi:hypothetical protein